MSYFPHGAWAAIHAAQERRRREQQTEEEEMIKYSPEELESNWEFKIVRSPSGAFRRPEVFQMLLEEESLAGWELVEKLDDRRVRLKRRREARREDFSLPPGVDPYRTQYGRGSRALPIALGAVLALSLILVALGVFLAAQYGGGSPSIALGEGGIILAVLVTIGLLALVAAFARRR